MAFNERVLANLAPNFFELVAQESMHEALRPAFEYVCKVVSHARPETFAVVWRWRDELYTAVETALQSGFLLVHDASFSEFFYCLKRVASEIRRGGGGGGGGRGGGGGGGGELKVKERILSILFLVFIPYLKLKLQRLYSRLTDENDVIPLSWSRGQSSIMLLRFFAHRAIPYLLSLWTACLFLYRVGYLIGQWPHYSPLLWIAGVTLVRQTQEELSSPSSPSLWRRLVGHIFSLALLSLKLLEWWHSGEHAAAVRKISLLPVPPPPQHILQNQDGGIPLPSDPHLCPLCHQIRDEPTALTTSGYVFCNSCIAPHLQKDGRCPITFLPTTSHQMIKLFTQQDPL